MSTVVIVDGGPRKGWNTGQLLDAAERGAHDVGATVERVRLFELDVKDCYGCMTCKRVGNKTEGLCAIRDDLRPVLEACYHADGIVIGTPIYFGNLTGQTVAFTSRLTFPIMHYADDGFDPIHQKKHVGLIMTMGATEPEAERMGYRDRYDALAQRIATSSSRAISKHRMSWGRAPQGR